MTTVWTNWPLTERRSPPGGPASEMNEAFFEKWRRRDENHRTRICPGGHLSEQVNFPPLGVWTPLLAAPSKLWVPPWAEQLVVRCCVAINGAVTPEDSAVGHARAKLGTVVGTEMTVWLQCFYEFFPNPVPGGDPIPACTADHPGADGWPGTQALFDKESVIEIPEAMRDTEQDFTYEVRREHDAVLYVRVFNDARDATNGHRHRHWLFREAS